jgi:hypothetical protein
MIDDFRVPFDEQFGWDKYEEKREIRMEHIEGTIGDRPVFFPNYPASLEGAGIARGYCVIPTSEQHAKELDEIPLLRRCE